MNLNTNLSQPLILSNNASYKSFDILSKLLRRFLHDPRLKTLLLLSITAYVFIWARSIMNRPFFTTPKLDYEAGMALFPLELEDFPLTVDLYRAGIMNTSLPKPINLLYANVNFSVSPVVNTSLDILIIIKSARSHFRKREIIRQTWGSPKHLEENLLLPQNLSSRLLFICGKSHPGLETEVESQLVTESGLQKDMIIAEFIDSYHNNTYKSLLAFKWALTELGGDFKYLLLMDDDIFVDMANVGSFIKDLKHKRVIKDADPYSGFPYYRLTSTRYKTTWAVSDIYNGLYIGKVYHESLPYRDPKSKWHSSYEDYNYNMFPPYIAGAGIIFDYKAVSDMYYASHFLKHYWIDDTYLGIIAAKLGIIPLAADKSTLFILHGFQCTDQILDYWERRDFKNLIPCSS